MDIETLYAMYRFNMFTKGYGSYLTIMEFDEKDDYKRFEKWLIKERKK